MAHPDPPAEIRGTAALGWKLTALAVVHPFSTLSAAALLIGVMLFFALGVQKEVGYAAYLGPNDPQVEALGDFLQEFQSGLHVVLVFSCGAGSGCVSQYEESTLATLGRLHSEIEQLPNVHKVWSLLNSPILVGPLDARTLGRSVETGWRLQDGWRDLVPRISDERSLVGSVVSEDGRTAGIVIELESVQSAPTQAVVRGLLELIPKYEKELSTEIYMAGDPVWTVLSSDSLGRDSTVLTGLMFLVMLAVLGAVFRDISLAILPVVSVGVLAGGVQGVQGLLGIPMTSILAALPPVLVVIAVTASTHLLTSFARRWNGDGPEALLGAAREVGAGCFWAAVTTAAGFGSFMLSSLTSFRHFGLLAAIGLVLAFILNFTLLPALLCLRSRGNSWSPPKTRALFPRQFCDAMISGVAARPRFILFSILGSMFVLATGATQLFYATDVGFGEQSYIIRSLRFIEANFRKPMTTEVVITIPDGSRVFDETSIRLLDRVERIFESEPSTGAVWSFLDLLEEAHRVDQGRPASSLDELVASSRRLMAIVAAMERAPAFWSERTYEDPEGIIRQRDRARVSVDRAWLDDTVQAPYVERIASKVAALDQQFSPQGYQVKLEGGLILAQRFLERLRETQWRSFAGALLVVSLVLFFILYPRRDLVGWAVVANLLPILALVGLMGWARIGVDPANMMVAAILISVAVDDTLHVAIVVKRQLDRGCDIVSSLEVAINAVGEAVVVSSICLGLGFSVLAFSEWGGLVSFGLLASLGVIFALVGDLLLFPAALTLRTAVRAP